MLSVLSYYLFICTFKGNKNKFIIIFCKYVMIYIINVLQGDEFNTSPILIP